MVATVVLVVVLLLLCGCGGVWGCGRGWCERGKTAMMMGRVQPRTHTTCHQARVRASGQCDMLLLYVVNVGGA